MVENMELRRTLEQVNNHTVDKQELRCKQEENRTELRVKDCIQLDVRMPESRDKRVESTMELRSSGRMVENKELLCKREDCTTDDCKKAGCIPHDHNQGDCKKGDYKQVGCMTGGYILVDCKKGDYRQVGCMKGGCILRDCKPVDCKTNRVGYDELELCSLALVLHTGL
jgi:hypothetical protein